jgi:hypothetical protein
LIEYAGWTNQEAGIPLGELIVQNHIEQRLVDTDAAVVFDEAELAKAIHEEADAGARGTDHLCQSFLCDGGKQVFRFVRFAEFGHQKKNSRQTPFTGVEKLIDKIGLGSYAADQQEFQVHFGEGILLVHHTDHLFPLNPERCTGGNGRGSCHMHPTHAGQRLLSNEFPGGDKRDGGLLAVMRNDGKFCAARLKIEDGVSHAALRKESLLGLHLDDSSSYSCRCQKGGEIKGHASHLGSKSNCPI